jgi:hypothetical protein
MMDKQEEQLAQELDAFLTARQQGRPTPPISAELKAECRLADDLLQLAGGVEMDARFLSELEERLTAAAKPAVSPAARSTANKKAVSVKSRPTFWGDLITQIEELFTMKKISYAFGAVMALMLIGAAVWFVWPGGPKPEEVAQGDGTQQTEVIAEAPVLPPLPGIGTGQTGAAAGMGGGGGDMVAGESAAPERVAGDMMTDGNEAIDIGIGMPWWNPLENAAFTLGLTLPTEGGLRPVYSQDAATLFSLERANQIAAALGFSGGAYTEKYPDYGEPNWTPPTYYNFFDGRRHLFVSDSSFYYYDNSVIVNEESDYMAYAQAAPAIENFLRERGFLNHEYEMSSASYSPFTVQFKRLINGQPINFVEFEAAMSAGGQLLYISNMPLTNLAALGDYPIRSAAEAWQKFLDDGVDYNRITVNIMPGPGYEMPIYDVPPSDADGDWAEKYRYWERRYAEGETVKLNAHVIVYMPAFDGGLPRIQLDQYLLNADADTLWAISEQAGRVIYLEATFRQQASNAQGTLELITWEQLQEEFDPEWGWRGDVGYFFGMGQIQRSGEQTFLASDDGEIYFIPSAPAELQDGERIHISGILLDETVDGRRIIEWNGLGRSPEEDWGYSEGDGESGWLRKAKLAKAKWANCCPWNPGRATSTVSAK